MILDAQCQLNSSLAIASATTTVSENSYDLGAEFVASGNYRDVGAGEPLAILVNVEVAADHTTEDETYQFDIIVDSTANLATAPVVIGSVAFTAAEAVLLELAAGKNLVIPIPPLNGHVGKRYLGMQVISGGTTPSITISAWIVPLNFVQQYRLYPTAIVVL